MGLGKLIKNYHELGREEFLKRWKEGIAATSPLEQTKAQLVFTRWILLGISLGFMVSIYKGASLWWLSIILGGAFGNTYLQFLATKQKLKALQQVDDLIKQATEAQTN